MSSTSFLKRLWTSKKHVIPSLSRDLGFIGLHGLFHVPLCITLSATWYDRRTDEPFWKGFWCLLMMCLPASVLAQQALTYSVISNGGGFMTSAQHRVLATLGQPLAGTNDRLSSGFWVAADGVLATAIEAVPDAGLPSQYRLRANYPNPFNPTTTILYELPERAVVQVEVFNVLGRRIALLADTQQPPGTYRVTWNGRDDAGAPVASGLYLYRLSTPIFTHVRKMLLVK